MGTARTSHILPRLSSPTRRPGGASGGLESGLAVGWGVDERPGRRRRVEGAQDVGRVLEYGTSEARRQDGMGPIGRYETGLLRPGSREPRVGSYGFGEPTQLVVWIRCRD
jgi:hypothetical protein